VKDVGVVTGGQAEVYYGLEGIPGEWLAEVITPGLVRNTSG